MFGKKLVLILCILVCLILIGCSGKNSLNESQVEVDLEYTESVSKISKTPVFLEKNNDLNFFAKEKLSEKFPTSYEASYFMYLGSEEDEDKVKVFESDVTVTYVDEGEKIRVKELVKTEMVLFEGVLPTGGLSYIETLYSRDWNSSEIVERVFCQDLWQVCYDVTNYEGMVNISTSSNVNILSESISNYESLGEDCFRLYSEDGVISTDVCFDDDLVATKISSKSLVPFFMVADDISKGVVTSLDQIDYPYTVKIVETEEDMESEMLQIKKEIDKIGDNAKKSFVAGIKESLGFK